MRNFYKPARMSWKLTQGSIINNCVASKYNGTNVWGLIVTPRCDLAHEGKVSEVHYLPIVNFADFFKVDGRDYLYRKWHEAISRKFFVECDKYKFPSDLDKRIYYETMCKNKIADKGARKAFLDKMNKYFDCFKENKEFNETVCTDKKKEDLVDNLIDDRLPSFYLIEDWNPGGRNSKVILLRDLKRIAYTTAKNLEIGMARQYILDTDDMNKDGGDDLCQVCAEVKSPFVEHIIQRFSQNFCRIGVDDRDTKNEKLNLLNLFQSLT